MAGRFGRSDSVADLPKIIAYEWKRKQDGTAETTITRAVALLMRLSRIADINDPDQIREVLSKLNWKATTKNLAIRTYTGYLKYLGLKWEAPHYQETQNIPFIPTEQEIDLLIAGARPKLATIIQILKETGARIGELQFLTWTNIDTERKTIYITPEKGSNARILPLSDKLIGMVNKLPRKTERVFTKSTHTYQDSFDKLKRRVAAKIGNPRLLKIHPHTLRHWKGTMEYHKTKDIMHVKQVLGHKTINATMLYINTEQALFLTDSDEWTCKVARTEEEEQKLIEANFTFVNKREEPYTAFYRKRK